VRRLILAKAANVNVVFWQGFCVCQVLHAQIKRGRASAEQVMTEQYHFDTVKIESRNSHAGRVRALLAKRQADDDARKQREIEINRRTATQLRMMIASLEQELANLDVSIGSELALAHVRDPSHFAYPISARTMQKRRENLKATIAALSDRLQSTGVSGTIAV
jgi:hypothetical protein